MARCYAEAMMDDFELLGKVTRIEVIAVNLSIRERKRLKAQFGGRRWRKLKGEGRVWRDPP
ncbi:MAG TPA: hypothetical protein VGX03_21585, partial [Candidatus Binatia bacterium]|nr:hypothetical protein [Candidatus Binatia bacterium]